MHIHAHQHRGAVCEEPGPGFFPHLAAGRGLERRIVGFHVATGLEPAAQPAMEDQQYGSGVGREYQAAGCDVSGVELMAGKGLRRLADQLADEAGAAGSHLVRSGRKGVEQGQDIGGAGHALS